jgi:hypothetical protein
MSAGSRMTLGGGATRECDAAIKQSSARSAVAFLAGCQISLGIGSVGLRIRVRKCVGRANETAGMTAGCHALCIGKLGSKTAGRGRIRRGSPLSIIMADVAIG